MLYGNLIQMPLSFDNDTIEAQAKVQSSTKTLQLNVERIPVLSLIDRPWDQVNGK